MKYIYLLFFSLIVFSSCQVDENSVVQNNSQSIASSSPLKKLISRVAQNPTNIDNVIDSTSCFSVQLPVSITVNNQQLTINSQDDFQEVQDIKDNDSNDDDIVHFSYPITIKYKNYSTQVLNNEAQYYALKDECVGDDFNEINCVSFVFPIILNVYNSNNQVVNTVTINDDLNMYNYFENLSSNTIVAVNYPISMLNSNGNLVVISSNNQFENFIEDAIDDCDTNVGNNPPELVSTLTTGNWHVSYFYYDSFDDTNFYNGYNFTFNANGTLFAVKNGVTTNGTWQIEVDGSEKKLNLNFDVNALDSLEEDWKIIEFTPTVIRTRHGSGGNGDNDYLTLTKN